MLTPAFEVTAPPFGLGGPGSWKLPMAVRFGSVIPRDRRRNQLGTSFELSLGADDRKVDRLPSIVRFARPLSRMDCDWL